MSMEMNDNFYDKDKGEFNTGEDMKIAKVLGDDIDNPKYTFRLIESITDKRIESLSKKFYEIKKESDSHKLDFDNMGTDIDNIYYLLKVFFILLLAMLIPKKFSRLSSLCMHKFI